MAKPSAVLKLLHACMWTAALVTAQDLDAAMHRIYAMDAGTGADGKVVSMADNNLLFKNGESVAILNKGERWTGPVNDFDEFSASGPIYGSVRAGGEHVMSSGRLKGQRFSFGNNRRAELGIWVRALEATAVCTITTNAGAVDTRLIPASAGTIFSFSTTTGGDQGVTVACSADVVVATGHTSETDYMVVAPESTEWYGVASTVVSLSQSGMAPLEVTESCSDGSSRTYTIPGGGTGAVSQNGYTSHFNGKACRYSAQRPFNVHGYGDGDGGDAVNMLSTSQGSASFGTSTDSQFLAFASLEPGICTCTDGTGTAVEIQVDACGNGVCKGKFDVASSAGTTCDCTTPMWGIMECADTNDEQLFYGDLTYDSAAVDTEDPGCTVVPECPLDATGVAALQQELSVAVQTIADRDASIQSLQQNLAELSQIVAARTATIQSLEQGSTESAQALADRDATIEELQQAAVQSTQMIADRDATIVGLQEAAATDADTIADRDAAIAERDATIAELRQALADSTTECPGTSCPADVVEDGAVNTEDLLAVLAAFNRPCVGSG